MSLQIAFVTCPDVNTARTLARSILEARLAACVNILSGVESLYHWKGKIEESSEFLLLIKSDTKQLGALEEFILREHPYDVPEFLCVESSKVSKSYEAWVNEELE